MLTRLASLLEIFVRQVKSGRNRFFSLSMFVEPLLLGTLAMIEARRKGHKTMSVFLISVVNQSAKVKDQEIIDTLAAIQIQLARDVGPIWGIIPGLEFIPAGETGKGIKCVISDTPDIPNAAGYHDQDGIKVFVIDGNDWRVTLSHEILELTGDAPANIWVDGPGGADYARELCDAVESDTYEINGIPVSNFVYPAFFDPNAVLTERLDYLGKLTQPFHMSKGGYQIKRTEPGRISQIFGDSIIQQLTNHVYIEFGIKFPEHKRRGKASNAIKRRATRR
jgi:hypothetical protein